MGNPKWSYDNMVKEACRIITESMKVDKDTPVEDLELRLKACNHDNNFYFDCGIAASNVANDICMNGSCDEMNAMLGGLSMFEELIGLEDE